jgi:LCP family protein required for cell wall assembly
MVDRAVECRGDDERRKCGVPDNLVAVATSRTIDRHSCGCHRGLHRGHGLRADAPLRTTGAALRPERQLAQQEKQRTENWADGPLNLLLLGSDSRATEQGGVSPIGERSDTIMIVHIARARDRASIVSIPRDSYVSVPAGGRWAGGKNKINAAFSFGGAPLAAKTVQQLTGVPLDGAMIADFGSVRQLVDAVDGVRVCITYRVSSIMSDKVWDPGCHDMTGAEADEFTRQRYDVPGGDFGRIHNQQLVIKAMIAKLTAGGLLTNPLKFDDLLITAADALTVDEDLDLRDLALAVRDIRPANVTYGTVPHTSASLRTSAGDAVELDPEKAAAMFTAIKDDTIDRWLTEHKQPVPGE